MNQLQNFVERGVYGITRVAYVSQPRFLPPSAEGMDGRNIASFSAIDEVLDNPRLKAVFQVAIQKGLAIVATAAKG
jgi:hypothetical protein